METMHIVVQALLILLLVAGIAVAARVFILLGSTKTILESKSADIDRTVAEVNRVLAKVETVTGTADKLITEEIGPTLRIARATITDVEVITRALADTTTSVRRLTGRAEAAVSSSKLLSAGSVVAQLALKQGARQAGGLLAGLGGGIMSLLFHRNHKSPKPAAVRKATNGRRAHNELIIDDEDNRPARTGSRKR